jgi:hypothetical protein
MADTNMTRTTISTSGTVILRQRPSLLLMKVRLRVAEPTLALGLAKLKGQCESASPWLQSLGAVRIEFGEPHFDDQTDKDPVARMRADAARTLGNPVGGNPSGDHKHGVNVVISALWDIASMSAEETLILLDRLRFEATQDVSTAEVADESTTWANPADQLREMMTKMHQPPKDDGIPQFLCISRLGEEQLERALAEAFSRACRKAELLAQSAGKRLGGLSMIHYGNTVLHDGRHDKLMERQRCGAMLAGTCYDLGEHEIVSDDPRSAEFSISVNVSYSLE